MSGSRNDRKDMLLSLYQDERTVFRLVDVAMIAGETDRVSLRKKLNYYVDKNALLNPRQGIYAKPGFNTEELACRIFTPAYISLEYALSRSGLTFQYDTQITLVSYLSRTVEVAGITCRYRKIKDTILANGTGIRRTTQHVPMATPERAFIDMLYLDPDFYFDNTGSLDRELLEKLLPLYQSKTLAKRVRKMILHA